MNILFMDYETYFDDEYTLKKQTPLEYALDPRFEALGCAFAWNAHGAPFWVDGPDLPKFFAEIDLSETTVVSHNAQFDMTVLIQQYGKRPNRYGCTMSMAANWIKHHTGRISLAACCKYYGFGEKMATVNKTKGLHFANIKSEPLLYKELVEYGCDDVTKCRSLYYQMLGEGFPIGELDVIDWVVRMTAQPQFELDCEITAEHLAQVQAEKQALLQRAGLDDRENLMSDDKLAAMLLMIGVPCPTKVSQKTGREKWAFAKTDKDFTALLEHPNPDVQALVAARLGHKSTLEETRSQRFLDIGKLTTQMPIPLNYSGAHTHRFSGAWQINAQNLANNSKLRKALRAPKGFVVVSVDASQIEARLNAVLSGETWLIEAFRQNRDVYCEFATLLYGRNIIKQYDKTERFVGKTGILSLGYGSSSMVFQNMCRNKGDVILTDRFAAEVVALYRGRCPAIVRHWRDAEQSIIPLIAAGVDSRWGALQVGRGSMRLPNGNFLRYRDLKRELVDDRWAWTYAYGANMRKKLYGAKVVENECQALAFVHIAEVAMRVSLMTERLLIPAHQIHDELVYVVPEHLAEKVKTLVVREMSRPPDWLPEAPLAAEGRIGPSYGELK